jgi:type IV secretion system protein VirB9
VSWAYPGDQLIALRRQSAEADAAAPIATGVDVNALNSRYRIEGDNLPWRPLRVFELRAKGAEIAIGPLTRNPGLRLAFVRGPEGIMIELVQR